MANTFFLAYDAQTRTHLWVADADGSNARQLPDKTTDASADFFSPGGLFASNGKLFFSAQPSTDQPTDSFGEPFVSDGTAAGTFLLKDIRPGRGGSNPVFKATVGAETLFTAADGSGKLGLYATDGTADGTLLLNNGFGPVGNYGNEVNRPPDDFTAFKGRLFFTAQNATVGRELWVTDGTAPGTKLLLNIGTGDTASGLYSASPRLLTVVGDTLFFAATSPMTQAEGLWSTDGTPEGTHLVKDIYPTGYGSLLAQFTPFLGKLYFSANNGSGDEIWVSDGTAAGTKVLKDINAGGGSSTPGNFTVAGNTLFFTASVPYVTGTELYATDGTAAGTRLVKDILTGSGDSLPTQLHALGGRVVFIADDGVHGREVWASDGTADGTGVLADIYPGAAGSTPDKLTRSGDKLYFTATSPDAGTELWVTDGTAAGTQLVKDIFAGTGGADPVNLTAVEGGVLFSARDATHGVEAWFSDGTSDGTHLVADSYTASVGAFNLTGGLKIRLGDRLVAVADVPGYGRELWSTPVAGGAPTPLDVNPGSAQGIYSLSDNALGSASNHAVAGGLLYFAGTDPAHGEELWQTDGVSASLVADIKPGPVDGTIGFLTAFGGKAYFSANAGSGSQLYVSDGTPAGTHTVLDAAYLAANPLVGGAAQIVAAGANLFFVQSAGTSFSDYTGSELWVSDGSAAGTHLVKDVMPGVAGASYNRLTPFGDALLFTARTSAGEEPWISDGTAAGTFMLADINPGSSGSSPIYFTVIGSKAYFVASSAAAGPELWVTDGTTAGTQMVVDLFPGSNGSGPVYLTAIGDKLYFEASPGYSTGAEPYVTDGTAAGTVLLKDIFPGANSSTPNTFTALGDKVVFYATSGINSGGLYITDGTPAGTSLFLGSPLISAPLGVVGDRLIYSKYDTTLMGSTHLYSVGVSGTDSVQLQSASGEVVTNTSDYSVVDGVFYFEATSVGHGRQLWSSDGTDAGTVRLTDVQSPADLPSGIAPLNFVSTAIHAVAQPVDLSFSDDTSLIVPGAGIFPTTHTPVVTGIAEPGSTVHIYDGATDILPGTEVGTGTADAATGAFAIPTSALATGLHSLTATASDAAGHTSPQSYSIWTAVFDSASAGDGVANDLTGGPGADLLSGEDGDDILTGGGGPDLLSGGAGADTIRYVGADDSPRATPDLLAGFQTGVDHVDLSALDPASVAIAYVNGATFIAYAGAPGAPVDQTIVFFGALFGYDLKLGPSFQGLTVYGLQGGTLIAGIDTPDRLIGGDGAQTLIGLGGADTLSGGAGPDTFKYLVVSDSTPALSDVILDFEHGQDKIDLTGIAGGVVNVSHDGMGHSFVYFAPVAGVATGAIAVVGDVEDGDLIVDPGTTVFDTGAYGGGGGAGRNAFDDAWHARPGEAHVYLA